MTERSFNELRGEQVADTFLVDALPERMADELRAAIERAGR